MVESVPEVVEAVPEVVESTPEVVDSVPIVESVPEVLGSDPEVSIFVVENFAHAFSRNLFSRLRQKTWCKKGFIFAICRQYHEIAKISSRGNISQ